MQRHGTFKKGHIKIINIQYVPYTIYYVMFAEILLHIFIMQLHFYINIIILQQSSL